MQSENHHFVQIAPLDEHLEFLEDVAHWILDEWGDSTIEEIKAQLVNSERCPRSIIMISENGPIGLLDFKRYQLDSQKHEELWVNVLYVNKKYRGQGYGQQLVREGMRQAEPFVKTALYVYTDIPTFYKNLGWQQCSGETEKGMFALEYSSKIIGTKGSI